VYTSWDNCKSEDHFCGGEQRKQVMFTFANAAAIEKVRAVIYKQKSLLKG